MRLTVHRLALPLLALLPIACQGLGLDEAPREVPAHDARTFYGTTQVFGASFSPDGSSLLVTTDASGVFNAARIAVGGGEPQPLTRSTTDATFAVGFFPADERILFTRDQGGNELNHLYVREEDGREIDLTPGENLKARFAGWSQDDRSFFVLTNERDPQAFDLYRYEAERSLTVPAAVEAGSNWIEGYQRRRVFQNPGGLDVSAVGPHGRWVALSKTRNNADDDVFLRDLTAPGRPVVHVTPHEGNVSHGVQCFSYDGGTLFYTSDEGGEFRRVWSFDIETGAKEVVLEDDWDVSFYQHSRDGRYLVTGVNEDARTKVQVFEAATGKKVRLPKVPAGDIRGVSFERGGARMAFYVNGDTSPSNLYVLDLKSRKLTRLTDTLNPEIDENDLVTAKVVRYPSFDDLEIPALLYRPRAASAENPVPALVWVHGGPGGQSRKGYNPTLQHLVNHGYAILAVNNRGSSGYGKTFYHLDDRRHGEDDLQDCIYGRRYLETLPWIDGDRVGIIGGSYGGYMVCAALAFEPEAFDLGIDIFGVTNWVRTLESIPPWWGPMREALYAELGDPAKDGERLRARSPLFHAKNIRRPLLVIQGANDPRVLQAESDEMVAAVRANDVPVEYVLFPDEGHGFRKKENRIEASEAYLGFLREHL